MDDLFKKYGMDHFVLQNLFTVKVTIFGKIYQGFIELSVDHLRY